MSEQERGQQPNPFGYIKDWMENELDRRVKEEVDRRMKEYDARARDIFKGGKPSEETPAKAKPSGDGKKKKEVPTNGEFAEVSEPAKELYQYLRDYRKDNRDKDPEATPSYEEIRSGTGLSSNKVTDAFKELTNHDIIEREKRGRRKVVHFPASA